MEPRRDVFHAIADPTRRDILRLLAHQELSIAAIAKRFPVARTAVTKHLHVLAAAGLVCRHSVGREARYRIRPEPLQDVKDWLGSFEAFWVERLEALDRLVSVENPPD